jgi:hypothetical protein
MDFVYKLAQQLLFYKTVAVAAHLNNFSHEMLWYAGALACVEGATTWLLMFFELELDAWIDKHHGIQNPQLDSYIARAWWVQLAVATAQRVMFGFAIAKGVSPCTTTHTWEALQKIMLAPSGNLVEM